MMNRSGYNRTSIIAHWITAAFVVALFFTHEGDGPAMAFHIGGGAIIGVFLLWRVFRRLAFGTTINPDQNVVLNILSALVQYGLLMAIITVVVTGYFLPWSVGQPIDIYSLISIPSPIAINRDLHETMENLHDISGHAFLPLLALHIAGTLKHKFLDRDEIAQRMFRSQKDGI